MPNTETELYKANLDILTLLRLFDGIGWTSIREKSIQRIMYIAKVLYFFVHIDDRKILEDYRFSKSPSGPFSMLINNSIINLESRKLIQEDKEGSIVLIDKEFGFENDEKKVAWFKIITYILGLYGESKIFNFTIRDPLYDEAVESNAQKELDISPESITIEVLNEFKSAFEETLTDTSTISKQEYLELYFEYVFSTIIKSN